MAGVGGLRDYLNGNEELQNRLRMGERAFLAALKIPVSQKEDIVIIWLSQLLSEKAMTLSPEDLTAAWQTMNKLMGSERLKALCTINWLCPITSAFIEALVDVISSNCEEIIRECAVNITLNLLTNPALSPLITHSSNLCLLVCNGILMWLVEGHTSNDDISVASAITVEVGTHLRSQPNKSTAVLCVLDRLFVTCYKLVAKYENDDRKNMQQLRAEINRGILSVLFHHDIFESYNDTLSLYFLEETKGDFSDVEKLLLVVKSIIDDDCIEVSQYVLINYFTQFCARFKSGHDNGSMKYKLLRVLCYMLGISVQHTKFPPVVDNSVAAKKLENYDIDKEKREALLCSILQSLESAGLDLSVHVDGGIPLTWLEALAEELMKVHPVTVKGYECYEILLRIQPQSMNGIFLRNMWTLYNHKNNETTCSNDLYLAYDKLLSEVLEVCVKLRSLPKMLRKMLSSLKENCEKLQGCQIIPGNCVCEEKPLFPPRFMQGITKAVAGLGHNQIMPVWKELLYMFIKDYKPFWKESAEKENTALFVSGLLVMLWRVIQATPVLQAAGVANVAQLLAEYMTKMAGYGIKELVAAMLTKPHNNNLCGSVLLLCHSWAEVHSTLLTTDVGYSECPDLPKMQPPQPGPATDFSYVLPFISADEWAQITARVANFGNQPTQLALVQLVIQKLGLVALEQQKTLGDEMSNTITPNPNDQSVEIMIKYLFNSMDSWGTNIASAITKSLPFILTFIQNTHHPALAKYMVAGIKERNEDWLKYIKSEHFQDASELHPHILAALCSVLPRRTSRKRRHSQSQSQESQTQKNYCMKLLKKMSKVAPFIVEFNAKREEDNALWETLKNCGEYLKKLMEEDKCSSTYEENDLDITSLLDVFESFPLPYMKKGFQTALSFVILCALVNESRCAREQHISRLLHILNLTLSSNCAFRVFTYIDANCTLQWLIQKRLTFPFSDLSQHFDNLNETVMKLSNNSNNISKSPLSNNEIDDKLVGRRFDHLLNIMMTRLTQKKMHSEQVITLAKFLTDHPQDDTKLELFLHPSVLLLAACYRSDVACKWTIKHLTNWILHFLKKMDLATTNPPTAAAILAAHTIIVSANVSAHKKKSKEIKKTAPDDSKLGEESELASEEQIEKTHKWQKYLSRSFQLAEMCLKSGHLELEEFALTFLMITSQNSDYLKPHLPSNMLDMAWMALSRPNDILGSGDASFHSNFSLESLLAADSEENYEKLLENLLERTRKDSPDLLRVLGLWKHIITSRVGKSSWNLKYTSLEHLIPILVNLVMEFGTGETAHVDHVVCILDVLKELVDLALKFAAQSWAQTLIPCVNLPLHTLSINHFNQVFSGLVGIVNSLVIRHSAMIFDRTPSLLAAVSHLTTALIGHANQDHQLDNNQIKVIVECGRQLERMVRKLQPYGTKMNKIVHFTVATIVESLQLTTIYPAVKGVIESVVYVLLDLSNPHCLSHLMVALPPATTTLLKHLHYNYQTFHRFKFSKV